MLTGMCAISATLAPYSVGIDSASADLVFNDFMINQTTVRGTQSRAHDGLLFERLVGRTLGLLRPHPVVMAKKPPAPGANVELGPSNGLAIVARVVYNTNRLGDNSTHIAKEQ